MFTLKRLNGDARRLQIRRTDREQILSNLTMLIWKFGKLGQKAYLSPDDDISNEYPDNTRMSFRLWI
jgi:hypothetical protein